MKPILQLLGEVNLSPLSHLISAGHPSPALQILSPSVHYQKQEPVYSPTMFVFFCTSSGTLYFMLLLYTEQPEHI